MARMTEEEAHYWDEYYTKNPPKPGPNGTGFFTQFANQKSSCSPLMAIRIAHVTRTSAESWIAMQTKLDLWKERQNKTLVLKEFPKVAV